MPFRGFQRIIIFFGRAQGAAQGPVCPNANLATVDHGLSIRSCQTPLRPLLTLDRFPGHGLSYPAGSDSTARFAGKLSSAKSPQQASVVSFAGDHHVEPSIGFQTASAQKPSANCVGACNYLFIDSSCIQVGTGPDFYPASRLHRARRRLSIWCVDP